MRYLRGNSIPLTFGTRAIAHESPLVGFVDSDYDVYSTSGLAFFVYGCPVLLDSSKQRTVAHSTTEASLLQTVPLALTTTCVDFSYSTSASKIFLSHQYMKTTRDVSTSREAVAPSANYGTFAWQNLTSTTVPSLIRHFLSNTSARATMSPTSSPRHAIPTHSTLFVLISWEILRIASHIIH